MSLTSAQRGDPADVPIPPVVTFQSGAKLLMDLRIIEHITHQGIRHIAATHPDWPYGEGRPYSYWQIANATVMETSPFLIFFRTVHKSSDSPASDHTLPETDSTQRPKRKISPLQRSGWNTRIDGQTAVYKLYDKAERLLYTGISTDPKRRWSEHASLKLWWHLVAREEVIWCNSRDEAMVLEEEVERLENPKFGDTHRLGAGWRTSDRRRDPALDEATKTIADSIRDAILRGEYPPGSCLPKARALGEKYGVSKAMASSALEQLRSEKFLENDGRFRVLQKPGGES